MHPYLFEKTFQSFKSDLYLSFLECFHTPLGIIFSLFSCARFAFLLFDFQRTLPFGLVGSSGFEPPTLRLSGARSNHLSYEPIWYGLRFPLRPFTTLFKKDGGDEEDRTPDPLLARQVLSQLSYTPI